LELSCIRVLGWNAAKSFSHLIRNNSLAAIFCHSNKEIHIYKRSHLVTEGVIPIEQRSSSILASCHMRTLRASRSTTSKYGTLIRSWRLVHNKVDEESHSESHGPVHDFMHSQPFEIKRKLLVNRIRS